MQARGPSKITPKPEFRLSMHGDSKEVVIDPADSILLRRIGDRLHNRGGEGGGHIPREP